MDKKKLLSRAIDILLITAIVCLSAFLLVELSWPAIEAWQNRPRPGVQVCQQYVGKGTVNYLLYLPQKYDKDKKWPLVVHLHGAGEIGQDLEIVRQKGLPKIIEESKAKPSDLSSVILNRFILVSPQCPANSGWVPELVGELTEHICSTFSVDREHIYLTGYSMGGIGTWQMACQYPDRFAAIAPLCAGGNVDQAERLVNMPIWAFHGAKDETVSLETSKAMVDAVRKCGGHVEYTVYPDAGHRIWPITYRDQRFYEWLLAQRKQSSTGEKELP